MEADAMAEYPEHVSRAIGMHLLREGQFSVASTFVNESRHLSREMEPFTFRSHTTTTDQDGDKDMDIRSREDLQSKFTEMYDILAQLKASNLVPAIEWARTNSARLEDRGSNLEFELSKLQFIWLFKGVPPDDFKPSDSTPEGLARAFEYGRNHFASFQRRHLKEIAQLSAAMVYAPNLEQSPYKHLFKNETAFEEVALTFTREFCSLLGLSAESPLYIAVTAGSIALPRLIKYTTYMKKKKTEWTTENELAFETPLPSSMIYHPIFVCPVSKEQTTEQNPPMMLICGHVISQESLHNIAKSTRYKCPYCPQEGALSDAKRIFL
jgi:E3 ubiquitin-protein transferase RMND5